MVSSGISGDVSFPMPMTGPGIMPFFGSSPGASIN